MKGEGDEYLEAVRFVLESAKSKEVINTLLNGLDCAVEHRAVALQSELVRDAVNFEPFVSVGFVTTDLLADPIREDLRATTRKGTESRFDEVFQYRLIRHGVLLREVVNLNRGERLDVEFRELAADHAQEVRVVLKIKVGVESVDDVDLSHPRFVAIPDPLLSVLDRHRVGLRLSGFEARE